MKSRKGALNPMFGKEKSPEFEKMSVEKAFKPGALNPQSKGVILTHTITGQKRTFDTKISPANFLYFKYKNRIDYALKNKTLFNNVWHVEIVEKKNKS